MFRVPGPPFQGGGALVLTGLLERPNFWSGGLEITTSRLADMAFFGERGGLCDTLARLAPLTSDHSSRRVARSSNDRLEGEDSRTGGVLTSILDSLMPKRAV